MSKQSFKPNTAEIERLRVKKGWSLPELARKAVVSNRTLDSITLGNRVVISTISKVAKALGVQPDELLEDYAPETKQKGFEVAFTIRYRFINNQPRTAEEVSFEQYDETKDLFDLLDGLKALLHKRMYGTIEVVNVLEGSVIVIVNMTLVDILELYNIYANDNTHTMLLFDKLTILATPEEMFGTAHHTIPDYVFVGFRDGDA